MPRRTPNGIGREERTRGEGKAAVVRELDALTEELSTATFLPGSRTPPELRRRNLLKETLM